MSGPINTDENSFEDYKKYLEDSIGVFNLNPPSKPMNAYMRYFYERSCEQRSKGNKEWKKMTQTISDEWKKLTVNKKQYFEKMHEIRMKERGEIYEEYQKLIKKKKPATAWSRFFKKRYSVYAKEHPDYSAKQITRLVSSDWRVIPEKQKAKLEKEYQEEKVIFEMKQDDTERIELYKERVEKYNEQLNEQKQKIMKKFGVSKQVLERQKLLKKRQQKQRKSLQSEQRRRLNSQKRRKERQERNKKQKEQKQKLKKEKLQVQEKEKQKLQQIKSKAESTDKPAKAKAQQSEPVPIKLEQSKSAVVPAVTPAKRGASRSSAKPKNSDRQTKKTTTAPRVVAQPKKTKKIQKTPKKPFVQKATVKATLKKQVQTPKVKKQTASAPPKKTTKAAKPVKQAVKPVAKKTSARRGKK